ncbi:MAG: molybdenum cofactor cytidylyltransferase [Chloroflexota bacterium]|nr:molybdenum cofactor cytidylyltransferase [Chloroflexota bacterium]
MAAGGSSRLDSPKQLLQWGQDYLVNHVLSVIQKAGIQPITVVLGSRAQEIQAVLPKSGLQVRVNPDWQGGMSTSILCGLQAVKEDPALEGFFIFLCDQPFITPGLIHEMLAIYQQENAQIVAPRVNGQQCNPVLFRRSFLPQLMTISGDRGAKKLIAEHGARWLDWPDERLLLDIDSVEDYQAALARLKD